MSAPREPPSPEEMAREHGVGPEAVAVWYRAGVRDERARAGARERELEAEVARLEDRLDVANEQIGSDRRIASDEEKRLTVEVARLTRERAAAIAGQRLALEQARDAIAEASRLRELLAFRAGLSALPPDPDDT